MSVDGTGWRDLRLHLLIQPRTIASIMSIFLPHNISADDGTGDGVGICLHGWIDSC